METKQATKQVTAKEQELAQMQVSLHSKFTAFKPETRALIAQYFNSYNLTAWIYNELLDDDSKAYVDEAINLTRETYELEKAMDNVASPEDVQRLVDAHNHGE